MFVNIAWGLHVITNGSSLALIPSWEKNYRYKISRIPKHVDNKIYFNIQENIQAIAKHSYYSISR